MGGSTSPRCGRIIGSPYRCACIACTACYTMPHLYAAGCGARPLASVPFRPCQRVGRRASAHLALCQDLAWQGTLQRALPFRLRRLTRQLTPPGFGKRARDGHFSDSQLRHFACRRRRSRGATCCAAQLRDPRPDHAACAAATWPLSAGAPAHTDAQHCHGRQEGFRVMDTSSRIARLHYSP